ncbi:MAG: hypothetical protein Q8904_01325 [Bacteroidota bacterium]|nr:hypothetical protein [Bacteroidota bacterium]
MTYREDGEAREPAGAVGEQKRMRKRGRGALYRPEFCPLGAGLFQDYYMSFLR